MRGIDAGERLAGRALVLFASRIVVLGVNFTASVLVARGLGPTGRGIYALAVLIPMLAAQTVSLGLNGAAVYFTGQGRYSLRQVVSTLFWTGLFLGGGSAILAAWVITRWGRTFLSEFPSSLLPLALISLPFLLSADFLGHVLLGQEKTRAFALQSVIQSAVLLLVQAYGFLWAQGQIKIALAGWVISQAAAALWAMVLTVRNGRLGFVMNWTLLREAVRYSIPGYATNWLQFLNLRLDQLLIYSWVGSTALGQYAVAVSLTEALWQLPASVGAVLFARVSAADKRKEMVATSRVSRLTMLAMIGLALLTYIIARPLITLLFGPSYQGALPALYALLPGTVALVLPNVIGGYLYGRGTPHYVTYGAGIALLATVVWNILLIPPYGIVGAGLASTLAYCVYGGAMLVIADRLSGEPWYRFLIPSLPDWQWVREAMVQLMAAQKPRE